MLIAILANARGATISAVMPAKAGIQDCTNCSGPRLAPG